MHAGSMTQSKRRRLYEEPLLIVEQWTEQLDPQIAAYRRMTYSTGIALEEMCHAPSFARGIVRLFTNGSVTWLMSRPFVHSFRALRRKVRRPYWRKI